MAWRIPLFALLACAVLLAQGGAPPDDALYPLQWSLRASAEAAPGARADIEAERAWSLTRGSPGIVIAILDCGVQIDHPDLAGRFCENAAERDGSPGVDDDANGYVDDVLGWNFARDSADISTRIHHGTEMAGLIAALGNNGLGIAGLAGGTGPADGCRVLPVAVGDQPRESLLADAIRYAVARGARVLVLSLSVPRSDAVSAAIHDAVAHGVTVVCSAGNNLAYVPFPADQPDVIPVASTDSEGRVSSFSSPGDALRDRGLAAPGDNVLTLGADGGYRMVRGTSFAAAEVAATVGLMLSRPRGATLAPAEVRELLRRSATPMDADPRRAGAGLLNAFRALQLVDERP